MVSVKFLVVLALIAATATTADATSIKLKKANCGVGKDGFIKGLGSVFNGLGGILNIVGGILGNLLQPRKPSGFASSIDITVDLSLGVGRLLDRTLIGGLGKLLAKIYVAITKITVCILGPANCKVCQGTYHGIGPVKARADISLFLRTYGLLNLRAKIQALIDIRSKKRGITFFSPSQQVVLNAGLQLADILSINIGKQDLTRGLVHLSIIAGAVATTRSKKEGINVSGGLVDTCNAHLEEYDYIVITEVNYVTITTALSKCDNDKGAFEKVTEVNNTDDDNTDQDDNTNQDDNTDQDDKDRADKEKADKEQADKERADKERADKERADKERADKERADKERADKERADKERADKERADKERADKERADKERADKEKAAKEQAAKDKADKERADKEKAAKEQAAKDKAAKEQAAKDKAAKEQAAKEKAAKEKADKERADKERADKERADKERADKERADKEREDKERADREREDKERADKEREDKERADREREDKERADKDREDKERADKDREDKERADKEREDKERADKEREDKEKADQDQGGDDQGSDDQGSDDQGNDDQGGDYDNEGGVTTGGGIKISVGLGLGGLGNAVRKVFGVVKGVTNIVGSVLDKLLNFKNPRNFDDSAVVSVQLFQGFGSLLDVSFIKGLGSLVVRIFVLISKISICLLGKVNCSVCNGNYVGIGQISGDISAIIKSAGLSNCNQDIKNLINIKSKGKGITYFTVAEQIVLNKILDLSLLLNAKITKQTFPVALGIGITIFGTIGNTYSVQDNKTGDLIISGLVDACGKYLSNQGFNTISQTEVNVIISTVGRAKKDTKAAWCVKK